MKTNLPLRSLLALCALSAVAIVAPVTMTAQTQAASTVAAEAEAKAEVSLDSADWNYKIGQRATFTIKVARDGAAVADATVRYRVGPDMMPADWKTVTVPAEGLVVDGGTLNTAGFIRLTAVLGAQREGVKPAEVHATAGFEPEKIAATQTMPEDFDAFWSAGKADLAKVPLDPQLTPLPELSNDKIDVYHVSIRTAGAAGTRIHGILAEPKGPGPFPALLNVPGAGVRGYQGNRGMVEAGFITLQIGIHGVPVNLPAEVYTQLGSGALNGYPTFNLDDRGSYYYRRVYLACVRANDFLASREKWDGKNLLVAGGSQGGQLSIVTAGLDERVTGLAANYPAYSDVTGYLHGRAGGWPHMMRGQADGTPSRHATEAKIATTGYYDVVNFARRLKVPGFYSWGYNDMVCPPTSMHAAYNEIAAPKELYVAKEMGHTANAEQNRLQREWLLGRAGLR